MALDFRLSPEALDAHQWRMKKARSFAGFHLAGLYRNRLTEKEKQSCYGKQNKCCQQRMNGLYGWSS